MYYLRLSGMIPENKQREFEQTYRFAITQFPSKCSGYSVSKDVLKDEVYHFNSFWETKDSLFAFTHSSIFTMMLGAFNTLGKLHENSAGLIDEIVDQTYVG